MSEDAVDIKPTTDIFIAVFLSTPKNEPILVAIINAVLVDSGWERIVSATVLNPFNITDYAVDKRIVLDVRVQDNTKRFFNIEIQTCPHAAFKDRMLYGWADSYSSQLHRGQDYAELEPVFAIVITEFSIFERSKSDKIHLVFEARERDEPNLVLSDHFQVHLLRLYRLLRGSLELLDDVTPELAYWLLFLALGKKNEVEMTQIAEKYPIVREAFSDPLVRDAVQEFNRFQSDPKMRELARQHRLFMLDYNLGMNAARKEGLAEGEAKGEAKLIETARNLKRFGVDIETIAKATNLSFNEIERLD
jgi:predicted transposase/invertase (TIGR01784 family)